MPKNHFPTREFACKCGCGYSRPDRRLIETLSVIREAVGFPIVVTSGCRCPTHNRRVGGVPNSNHTHGHAADIQCRDIGTDKLWQTIRRLYNAGMLPHLAGLGRYNTFVHVDVEPKMPSRLREWDERK